MLLAAAIACAMAFYLEQQEVHLGEGEAQVTAAEAAEAVDAAGNQGDDGAGIAGAAGVATEVESQGIIAARIPAAAAAAAAAEAAGAREGSRPAKQHWTSDPSSITRNNSVVAATMSAAMQAVLARAAAQREDFQRADSPAVEGAEVEGDSIAGPAALGSPLPLPPAATGVADLPPTVPSSRLVSVSTSEDATLESTLELPLPTSPSDQTANTSSAGIPTDQLKLGPLTTATPSAHPEASAEGFDREVASWVSGAKVLKCR
eukprot:1145327-Pelagomonas_calceolata.AAC.5